MQLQNLFLSAFAMAAAVRGEMGGMSSELGSLMGSSSKAASSMSSGSGTVKVHPVKVGWNNTLTFSPDQLNVNPGEMVQFQFYPKVCSLSGMKVILLRLKLMLSEPLRCPIVI